jgi:RNA polymerase sigma-70 factor (ECF subfamily)
MKADLIFDEAFVGTWRTKDIPGFGEVTLSRLSPSIDAYRVLIFDEQNRQEVGAAEGYLCQLDGKQYISLKFEGKPDNKLATKISYLTFVIDQQTQEIEDLCQQVFLSVARAVESWEVQQDGPRFRNWLGRVTRNAILNALTRAKPDRATGASSVQDLLLDIPDGGDMSSALLDESRIEAFRWAARQVQTEFSASTWTMFHETTTGGRSIADVAKTMGSSSGAVYVARCRVMQRVKDKVNEVSDFWRLEL